MKISAKKIIERYESFFTHEQLKDSEVQDKIMTWTDRDIAWQYDRINEATFKKEGKVCFRKIIFDWVGSASQLERILNLEIK